MWTLLIQLYKNSLLSILRFKNLSYVYITLKQLIVFIDVCIWNCSSARLSHRSMAILTSPNAFSAPCLKRHHLKRFKLSDVLSLKQFIKCTNDDFIALSSNTYILTYIVDKYWHIYNMCKMIYRKTSNISRTLVGNKIVDNSDVVGASPVGAAPTTASFST